MKTSLCGCLLAVAMVTYGPVAAHPQTEQENAAPAAQLQDFAGTWHWVNNGSTFATMKLQADGGALAGTLTNASFDVDDKGLPTNALPRPGTSTIVHSAVESGVLHLWCKDGGDETEWKMRLASPDQAELTPVGSAARSLKRGIQAERVK